MKIALCLSQRVIYTVASKEAPKASKGLSTEIDIRSHIQTLTELDNAFDSTMLTVNRNSMPITTDCMMPSHIYLSIFTDTYSNIDHSNSTLLSQVLDGNITLTLYKYYTSNKAILQ